MRLSLSFTSYEDNAVGFTVEYDNVWRITKGKVSNTLKVEDTEQGTTIHKLDQLGDLTLIIRAV